MVQPLFRGFRTINAVNGAEATVRAGWETLRLSEQSVLLEAVTAYVDVVRDAAIVRLRENNVAVLTRDLRATQDRFKVGEVTRTDVAQAEARRAASAIHRAICWTQRNSLPCRRPSRRTWRLPRARVRTWWPRSIASRPPASPSIRSGASCCRPCSSRPTTPSDGIRRSPST